MPAPVSPSHQAAIPEEAPYVSPFLAANAQRQQAMRESLDGGTRAGAEGQVELSSMGSALSYPPDMRRRAQGLPALPAPAERSPASPAAEGTGPPRRSVLFGFLGAPGAGDPNAPRRSMDSGRTPRPRRTLEGVLARQGTPPVPSEENAGGVSAPSATALDLEALATLRQRAQRASLVGGLRRISASFSTRRTSATQVPRLPRTASAIALSVRAASAISDPEGEVNLRDARNWRSAEYDDRQAFGTGAGWSSLAPDDGDDPAATARNLAIFAEESEHAQSYWPVIKMVPTILGKMAVAIGADFATLGLSAKSTWQQALGGILVGTGVLTVMVGMEALARDMRRINPGRVRATMAFSALGMALISGSVLWAETDYGIQRLWVRGVAAVLFGVGLTLLNTSLPLSFAYSEIVHGDTFRDYRNEVAFAMWGVGLALATGLTVNRGAPRSGLTPAIFPFGVTHAAAVLGLSAATFGTCIVATNLQRQTGRHLALRTRLRQLAAEVGEDNV